MQGNREVVCRLANEIKAKVGVEIGVRAGHQSLALLRDVPTLELLHSVDPWTRYEGWHSYQDKDLERDQRKLDSWYVDTLRKLLPFGDRSIVVRMKAENYARFIKHKLDFVYIDGNHESPFVDRDIELWTPMVRPGGLVIGHDYSHSGTDVKRVVDATFGDRVILDGARVWHVEV